MYYEIFIDHTLYANVRESIGAILRICVIPQPQPAMACKETPFSSATCQLCSGAFTDPRMLGCLHSFCKDCLKKELEKVESQSHLKCPTCRRMFSLTAGGIDSLPKNLRLSFNVEIAEYTERMESTGDIDCDVCADSSSGSAVAFCSQCLEFLCELCAAHHCRARRTAKHTVMTISEKKQANLTVDMKPQDTCCSEPNHDGEVLKFYCETCQQLVCRDCVLIKHKEHTHSDIDVIARSHKEEMKAVVEPACGAISALMDAKGANDKMIQQVNSRVGEVHESIEKSFAELEKALKLRKKVLLDEASDIGTSKVTALMLQQKEFQRYQDSLQGYIDAIEGALQTHTDKEIIALGGLLQHELQASVEQFKKVSLPPAGVNLIPADFPITPLAETISSFGYVSGGSCPSQASVEHCAIIGKEHCVNVTTRNANGEAFKHGGEQVRGELCLVGSSSEPVIALTTDHGNGDYTLAFTPQANGEHSLSVTVEGNPIGNTPCVIFVRESRNYGSISQPKETHSLSVYPYGVAVGSTGDIFITHPSGILVQQPDGSTRTIGSGGSGPCQFSNARGIALSGDVMYVSDLSQRRIQKVRTSGEFVAYLGEGQLSNPTGLTLDTDGRIYVAEHGNNRVSVFEACGSFVRNIPGSTDQQNHLKQPYGLTFDHHGNLHVASLGTGSIVVYTPEGQFVEEYGQGQLVSPAGIAVDEEGFSLVAEYNSTSSRLQIFDSSHHLVRTVTGLNHLLDVTISKDGGIYVAEQSNKKLVIY